MTSLAFAVAEEGPFNAGDVMRACAWMRDQGLVEITSTKFVIPTDKGEEINEYSC